MGEAGTGGGGAVVPELAEGGEQAGLLGSPEQRPFSQGTPGYASSVRPLMLGAGWAPMHAAAGLMPPVAPTGLLVQPGPEGGLVLTWVDNSDDEVRFEVVRERQVGNGRWHRTTTLTAAADATSLHDSPGNGTYRYRVRAVNGAGSSEFTGWATMQVAGEPPAAPTQPTAADLGNGRDIQFSWLDNSDDETAFEVQRQALQDGVWGGQVSLVMGPNQPALTDAAGSGTYRYRVRAINSAGPSAYTAWAEATVAELSPEPPSNVQAADQGDATRVRITWLDNSSNETGFQLQRERQTDAGWSQTVISQLPANMTGTMDYPGEGTFRYRVRAVNSYGQSPFTPWATVSLQSEGPAIPAAPTGVVASDVGNRRALVSWTDNSDNETSFQLERSPAFPTGTVTVAANVIGYIDQCGPGSFSYRVRAVGQGGASAYSAWASVTVEEIAPSAPTGLQSTDMGNQQQVRLNWTDNSDNETGFRIERQTQGGGGSWGSTTVLTAPMNSTMHVDSPGPGTHRYRVAATNFAGDSPFTSWVTVTLTGGWTVFTPSADTRIVYVSSTLGNDANNGLSETSPVRTIGRGMQLVRNGYPDWLLLRRGDTFVESINNWSLSGRSQSEMIVLGSYGTAPQRPVIAPGTSYPGFQITAAERNHIAIVGIHFRAPASGSSASGIRVINDRGRNFLIEDCRIEGFAGGMAIHGRPDQGGFNDVRVRRSLIVDSAAPFGGHSQGAYFDGVNGLLIEECLIDHNGWRADGSAPATIFNHNVYIQHNCGPAIFRRNIVARASSHGVQMRSGGLCEDNVFVRNSLGILIGGGDPSPTHMHGISGIVRGNVILEGKDINSGAPRGMGIEMTNVGLQGATVENNIIAHKLSSSGQYAICLSGGNYGSGVGANNITVRDNIIYNWRGPIILTPAPSNPPSPSTFSSVSGNVITNNQIQDPVATTTQSLVETFSAAANVASYSLNHYHSARAANAWFKVSTNNRSHPQWVTDTGETGSQVQAIAYPDPARSVGSYHGAVGGAATLEAFLAEARQQSKTNWRPAYTAGPVLDYIRGGYR